MKKIIALLIILIALGELKAQNKHYEFTVVKPESNINVVLDTDYMIVKENYAAQFTQADKNRKYRFSFTHGTIEKKDKLIYIFPNKTGEGSIIIYEVVGKENILVKEITIDVYEKPMCCFGEICFSYKDDINDLTILTNPFTIKLKNETKELIYVAQELKFSWICNGTITEKKISGNIIDKTQLDLIDKTCNPIKLYLENIIYKDEKGNTKRSAPLILDYSISKDD